jgi:hypothetical protein
MGISTANHDQQRLPQPRQPREVGKAIEGHTRAQARVTDLWISQALHMGEMKLALLVGQVRHTSEVIPKAVNREQELRTRNGIRRRSCAMCWTDLIISNVMLSTKRRGLLVIAISQARRIQDALAWNLPPRWTRGASFATTRQYPALLADVQALTPLAMD